MKLIDEEFIKKNGITIGLYLLIAAFILVALGILFMWKLIGLGVLTAMAGGLIFFITAILRIK
jgi:hypothetical protein